jgi:hypothetical protein
MEPFNAKMQEYIMKLDPKRRAKYTIKQDTYNAILNVWTSKETNVSPKFRFWAKKTFINIKIGEKEFVHNKKTHLPVVTHEQLFEKIEEFHLAVGPSGRDKTWVEVHKNSHIFQSYGSYRSKENTQKSLRKPFHSTSGCATFVR